MLSKDYVPLMDRYSDEKFREIISNSYSYKEVMQKLGYKAYSGDSKTQLNKKIERLNIDISHFYCRKNPSMSRSDEEIFIENSPVDQTVLRKRYFKKFPPEKCSICGQLPIWNGQPLTLILDHINGKNHDDRLENLRWVCPNCNMQLPTTNRRRKERPEGYKKCIDCGVDISAPNGLRCQKCEENRRKQKAKDSKPVTREELKNLIQEYPFIKIGEKFGVSDNAIRKWCKLFNLPFKSSEIKQLTKEEWDKI